MRPSSGPGPGARRIFIAVDEFPKFVTATVADGLDELRKFGVRFVLAHQHLPQLGPELRGAIMGDAKLKIAFGGLSREDAEVLARELFTGEVRGDRVKHITYQTKFRPLLLPTQIETYTSGETDGNGFTDGFADGSTWGETQTPDDTSRNAISTTHSWSGTSGHSTMRSASWTRSLADAFITEHEEFIEETGRTYWTVEEEWERLVARLMNLDRREAIIKAFNRRPMDIETPDIEHPPAIRMKRRKPRPGQKPPQRTAHKDESASSDPLPEDFRE